MNGTLFYTLMMCDRYSMCNSYMSVLTNIRQANVHVVYKTYKNLCAVYNGEYRNNGSDFSRVCSLRNDILISDTCPHDVLYILCRCFELLRRTMTDPVHSALVLKFVKQLKKLITFNAKHDYDVLYYNYYVYNFSYSYLDMFGTFSFDLLNGIFKSNPHINFSNIDNVSDDDVKECINQYYKDHSMYDIYFFGSDIMKSCTKERFILSNELYVLFKSFVTYSENAEVRKIEELFIKCFLEFILNEVTKAPEELNINVLLLNLPVYYFKFIRSSVDGVDCRDDDPLNTYNAGMRNSYGFSMVG